MTLMTAKQTLDVTTPTDGSVRVTRVFDAPRQLVWDAHTQPALIRRWLLGPPGWTMPRCDVDFREGGAYLYGWQEENGGQYFEIGGTFDQIVPVERIVTTEWMMGQSSHNVLELHEAHGRTTMTMTMDFGSRAARDAALATGMTTGMGQSYDRLDGVLRSA